MASAPPAPPPSAVEVLAREQARVRELNAERAGNPILAGALERLAAWQSRRLAMTYADLAADPRYAGAVAFFQDDLYGPADFAQRDADLARVAPLFAMMLPERVVATVGQAVELNRVSQELDRLLLARLPRADGGLSVAEYCKAYRRAGNVPARRHQIRLILDIGAALDRYVRKPLLQSALTMMRQPARVAGLGALQEFLEKGFDAFQRMGGADRFLETIAARETAIMESIVTGSTAPFPDPFDPRTGSGGTAVQD